MSARPLPDVPPRIHSLPFNEPLRAVSITTDYFAHSSAAKLPVLATNEQRGEKRTRKRSAVVGESGAVPRSCFSVRPAVSGLHSSPLITLVVQNLPTSLLLSEPPKQGQADYLAPDSEAQAPTFLRPLRGFFESQSLAALGSAFIFLLISRASCSFARRPGAEMSSRRSQRGRGGVQRHSRSIRAEARTLLTEWSARVFRSSGVVEDIVFTRRVLESFAPHSRRPSSCSQLCQSSPLQSPTKQLAHRKLSKRLPYHPQRSPQQLDPPSRPHAPSAGTSSSTSPPRWHSPPSGVPLAL